MLVCFAFVFDLSLGKELLLLCKQGRGKQNCQYIYKYLHRIYCYSVIQLFSYSVIQLFSYSVIQLFSYSVIQLFKLATVVSGAEGSRA